MEELFYNLRVRKICNKNPEAIKEKNDKFDYKKKKVLYGKTQHEHRQQTREKNVCDMSPHVTEEGSVP